MSVFGFAVLRCVRALTRGKITFSESETAAPAAAVAAASASSPGEAARPRASSPEPRPILTAAAVEAEAAAAAVPECPWLRCPWAGPLPKQQPLLVKTTTRPSRPVLQILGVGGGSQLTQTAPKSAAAVGKMPLGSAVVGVASVAGGVGGNGGLLLRHHHLLRPTSTLSSGFLSLLSPVLLV